MRALDASSPGPCAHWVCTGRAGCRKYGRKLAEPLQELPMRVLRFLMAQVYLGCLLLMSGIADRVSRSFT